MKDRVYLGDKIAVDNVTMKAVMQFVEETIAADFSTKPKLIIAQNANKSGISFKDSTFREHLDKADVLIPDGISILISAKMLGYKLPERVTGIDVMKEMLHIADDRGYKVFFLGASENISQKLIATVSKQFPNIIVTGASNGYFSKKEEADILTRINTHATDILFVAMGSPKQEEWLFENRDRIRAKICIGVGGSFDIISGEKKRAPDIFIKLGVEFLYRMLKEPKRLLVLKQHVKLFYFVAKSRLKKHNVNISN